MKISLTYQYLTPNFISHTLCSSWLIVNQVFKELCHNRLLIIDERNIRHMNNDATCCQCGAKKETIMHLLRDCYDIQDVWDPSIK